MTSPPILLSLSTVIVYGFSVSKDAQEYMSVMVHLKNAIDYFGQHIPGSPEYSAVVCCHSTCRTMESWSAVLLV